MDDNVRSSDGDNSPFQVLCLSGGGFLGLFSALILEKLEARFGSPIAKHFDLICGTSIGGIIALGLAAEIPAADIRKSFEAHGPKIFPRPFSRWSALRKAMYSPKPLSTAICEIIGESTIVGDLKHPILIPAVNLTKGGPSMFKTPHHPDFTEDWSKKALEVGMATAAAPTVFPSVRVGDSNYADGGLFANSPDYFGAHEAEHFLGANRDNIRMLSIGTISKNFSLPAMPLDRGIFSWIKDLRLFNAAMSSQQLAVDHVMQHSLGERYLRIDIGASAEQSDDLRMDIANEASIATQKGLAETAFQAVAPNNMLKEIFLHKSMDHQFYHGPRAQEKHHGKR